MNLTVSNKIINKSLLVMFAVFGSQLVNADSFNHCSYNFYKGYAPIIIKTSLAQANYSFCYNGFAVQYSGVSRTGLWSAEYVTPERLRQAKTLKREDNFHEEMRVRPEHRATLNDYRGSGYDRGHLSPNADFGKKTEQFDSFNLTNMIPQSKNSNQAVWNYLEQAVRATITKNQKPAYIITGGMFIGQKITKIGKVLVPTHVYKVVFFPDLSVMGAYVSVNDESGRVDVVSVAQLEQYAGIKFFPTVSGDISTARFNMPLTPNAAARINRITTLNQNHSDIFNQLPDPSISAQKQSKQYPNNNQYNQNGAVEGKVIQYGIKFIEKALR